MNTLFKVTDVIMHVAFNFMFSNKDMELALLTAARKGDIKIVRCIVEEGLHNVIHIIDQAVEEGLTTLFEVIDQSSCSWKRNLMIALNGS